MDKKLEKIKVMCNNLNLSEGILRDEFLFTLVGMDLFYFNNNIGSKDIKDGYTDGKGDGGIDFIYSDEEKMYLIQGKSTTKIQVDDLIALFNKVHLTIQNFNNNTTSRYNPRLKSIYRNTEDSLDEIHNKVLVLMTNAEISEELMRNFNDRINNSELSRYEIKIFTKKDFDDELLKSETEPEFVKEDRIEIDQARNFLKHDEDGIIVNIKAISLRKLFEKHQRRGLFNMNLREHFSQKTVDDAIDRTIKREPDKFWYFNNGITIACQDYRMDGNMIQLYNFSIINGAQTTTKLSKSRYLNENSKITIVCKIIKTNEKDKDKTIEFMNSISEASNSQKPIKDSDLKANRPEQKRLSLESANNKPHELAISIKKGVRPKNYKKVESWQRVKNEYIGQLLLSVVFQEPGKARSAKKQIFSNQEYYSKLFMRNHDYNTIYDLVKLASKYDEYKVINKSQDDSGKSAVIRNGKFVILAIIGYLLKFKRKIVYNPREDKLKLMDDNLDKHLIQNYRGDDFDKRLHGMFDHIVKTLNDTYLRDESRLNLTSYSNFFKTDNNYHNVILKEVYDKMIRDDFGIKQVNYYLEIFDF